MLSLQRMAETIRPVLESYPVKNVALFGSYAAGTQNEDSDIDLLVEFDSEAVSLLTLSSLQLQLEEVLGTPVDLIHAPLPNDSFIQIGRTVELYAA